MIIIQKLNELIKIEDIIKEAINKIEIRKNNNYILKRFLIKN
jgi:hypothetical protein